MSDQPPQDPKTAAKPAAPDPPAQPEDRFSYRLAVAAVGVALVAFLIGAAVIAAGGKPVPTQYWATGSAISGALLGILAPSPTKSRPAEHEKPVMKFLGSAAAVVRDLWSNRALFLLIAVFGVSVAFAIVHNSAPLETVAAAAGGALVGLLAPPPSSNSSGG